MDLLPWFLVRVFLRNSPGLPTGRYPGLLSALLVAIGVSVAAAAGDGTAQHPYHVLEHGRQSALAQGRLLLLEFTTPGCVPTTQFHEQTLSDRAVRELMEEIVFTTIDVSEDPGRFIGQTHQVSATPTFALYDPARGPRHQWQGWDRETFLQNLGGALSDTTLAVDRVRRFESAPTAQDAALLGFFFSSTGETGRSYRAFRAAERLEPSFDFAAESFDAAIDAFVHGEIEGAELDRAASRLLDRAASALQVGRIGWILARAYERGGEPARATRWVESAWNLTEDSDDPLVRETRANLAPYHALYLDKDPDTALRLRASLLGEDWEHRPGPLNDLAWWCAVHGIALRRAEDWAREAIRSQEDNLPGRANARDTLAEILLRQNRKDEAIAELRLAVREDPTNLSYREKLGLLGVSLPADDLAPGGTARER